MVINDETVEKNIQDQLFWDSRVDETNVNVQVNNGQVTLTGTVPTATAKRAAEDDALVIPGVNSLKNLITIQFPENIEVPTDTEIKNNIKNVFIWNPVIDISDVDLEVDTGVVTLKGTIDSYWKKIRAEELAFNMSGVIDVVNELAVVPTESYLDKSIAEDIINAFDRNINIDVDTIDVTVKDGVVTLSGTLDNWYGIRSAYDIAQYTYGVKDVVNNITLE